LQFVLIIKSYFTTIVFLATSTDFGR